MNQALTSRSSGVNGRMNGGRGLLDRLDERFRCALITIEAGAVTHRTESADENHGPTIVGQFARQLGCTSSPEGITDAVLAASPRPVVLWIDDVHHLTGISGQRMVAQARVVVQLLSARLGSGAGRLGRICRHVAGHFVAASAPEAPHRPGRAPVGLPLNEPLSRALVAWLFVQRRFGAAREVLGNLMGELHAMQIPPVPETRLQTGRLQVAL